MSYYIVYMYVFRVWRNYGAVTCKVLKWNDNTVMVILHTCHAIIMDGCTYVPFD
jgi:hypothetical protein